MRSAWTEAAVAEVLATVSVEVSPTRTRLRGMRRAVAAICAIFVKTPWPISQAPWATRTVPSA